MNILNLIIGIVFIIYGLYGVIKKKIINPFVLLPSTEKWRHEAAKNMSNKERQNIQNYMVQGSYAVIEGIILLIIGIAILIVNF